MIVHLPSRTQLLGGLLMAVALASSAGLVHAAAPGAHVPGGAALGRVRGGCYAPRLKGLVVREARSRATTAGCRLRILGPRVKMPAVQTVAEQHPRRGRAAKVITVSVNPLCFRSALSGPPNGEPIVKRGPTRLVTGLFLVGGPLVEFSAPRCAFPPASPWAGTITVTDAATGAIVATQTVAEDQLARIDLAPGTYTISGTFADASTNVDDIGATPQTIVVPSGKTVRQDITADVP